MVRLAISVGSIAGTNDYLALFDYNVATLAKALGAGAHERNERCASHCLLFRSRRRSCSC